MKCCRRDAYHFLRVFWTDEQFYYHKREENSFLSIIEVHQPFTKPIPFHYHTRGQSWLPKNRTLASKPQNSPVLLHSLNSVFSWWLGTLLFSQSKPTVTPPKPGSQSQAWRRAAPDELAPGLCSVLLWHLKAFALIAFSKVWIYRQGT